MNNTIIKTVLIFCLCTLNLFSQSDGDKILNLENSKNEINGIILSLNDSIKKINTQLLLLKSEEIRKQINDTTLIAIIRFGSSIRTKPFPLGEVILNLKKDTEVNILDYYDGNFAVCLDSICGFTDVFSIKKNQRIEDLILIKKQKEEELERQKKEREIKKENIKYAEIEKRNIKRYGKVTYDKLKNGYVWLGMTDEMALISLGSPDDINRTVSRFGVHEQWVYGNEYYYFENRILTSYQD